MVWGPEQVELLLDTCTFLWMLSGDSKLSQRVVPLLQSPENSLYLSAGSCWEISIKHRLGKLELPDDPADYIPAQREAHGIEPLAIGESATLLTGRLPAAHQDPFDRILIAQALDLGLTILSPDPLFKKYPVKTIW